MNCPACKNETLAALELNGVEVDWCAGCRGVWLDRGELELLHEDAATAAGLLAKLTPEAAAGHDKGRRCPACLARMKRGRADWAGGVVLDECPKQDGIWFDHGELETLLKAAGGAGAQSG
ncbi:MAG: zf-TFIIB domain-containing protein, partial [Candidatus Omnitrophica bacterium]|nr:zf-TFIIB domain-containing protein [Candidatus Omnitrophota bacterium]